MIGHVVGILIGLLVLFEGVVTLVKRSRLQPRLRKAPGVFVGREDVIGPRPAVRSRSGRFRFTTEEGRVIEAAGSFYSFPGPKPGKPVTVVYDPARPERTAERAGVSLFLLVGFGPLLMAIGLATVIANAAGL